jgi:hypothetical protein
MNRTRFHFFSARRTAYFAVGDVGQMTMTAAAMASTSAQFSRPTTDGTGHDKKKKSRRNGQ